MTRKKHFPDESCKRLFSFIQISNILKDRTTLAVSRCISNPLLNDGEDAQRDLSENLTRFFCSKDF